MFRKLKKRFIALNMVIISVVMIAAFGMIYFTTYTNVQAENKDRLDRISSTLAVTRVTDVPEGTISGVRIISPDDYAMSFSIVLSSDNVPFRLQSFLDLPEETYLSALLKARDTGEETGNISLDGKLWMFQTTQIGSVSAGSIGGPLVIAENCSMISFLDITDSQAILTRLLVTFGIIGFLMLFVIFGISVFFAGRAVAPVELAFSKQKQFVADASHELKTPISSILANADALSANGAETVESQEKWVEHIRAEAERMGGLVGDLLYLAKTDNAEVSGENLPFSVSDAVREAVVSMEAAAFEKGLTLVQNVEADVVLSGDVGKLRQVVTILLDNAIKYSDFGGCVEVVLEQIRHQVMFLVKNTGEGIPREHLPRIFDRFYRADPSREHDGGYGLGLSIAKATVEGMGGKIYASSVEGQGATFVVTLNK